MQLIVDGILDLMKWKKKHSPYEACIGKVDKVKYKREKLKEFLFMNLDVVILNRILANWIKEDIKKIIHITTTLGLFQEHKDGFDIRKSMIITYYLHCMALKRLVG